MSKSAFLSITVLAAASTLLAQDAVRFNGTWKGSDNGQVRKLTYKDGVVHMEENNNGRVILRDYPAQGQEITMNLEGFFNGAKATGKMEGNKLAVDTEMPNGTKWHDEWTLADDGKSYSAVRITVAVGTGGVFGGGAGGRSAGGGAAGGGNAGGPPPAGGAPAGGARAGGGRGRAGGGAPETFTKIE